jgi:hypothetical protein
MQRGRERARFFRELRGATRPRLTSPGAYEPIAALKYLHEKDLLSVGRGDQWLLELTLDGAAKESSKDLRPDLPVVIRY